MEKYKFNPGGDEEQCRRYKELMDMLHGLYGEFWSERHALIIRIPAMGLPSDIERLVGKPEDTFPALVKKIKTRLWDDQACEAFGELIELINNRLKKLEKE